MKLHSLNDSMTQTQKNRVNLDVALLRTFVAVAELGSVARASDFINRSQPATSLQLKRLEDVVGFSLFKKSGRNLRLSEGGDVLLGQARRILNMNDEIITSLNTLRLSGSIRFGISQDFAADWLTDILARISRVNPALLIEVRAERSPDLHDLLSHKQIDFALMLGVEESSNAQSLGIVPLTWIGTKDYTRQAEAAVPLVTSQPPCELRQMAINALETANIPWRLAFSSPSLSCQRSALEAGLGVSVRTHIGLSEQLTTLNETEGLPVLAKRNLHLLFHRANDDKEELAGALQDILTTMIREKMNTYS